MQVACVRLTGAAEIFVAGSSITFFHRLQGLQHTSFYILYNFIIIFTMRKFINVVEFDVLAAMVMKSTIFWNIKPCSPLKLNRRFGGIYRLRLQGRRISRARNQRRSRWRYVPPKRLFTFNGLHGVISQKMLLL
jgi:hypothetical protein